MKKVLVALTLSLLLAACGGTAATPDMTEQPLPPPPDITTGDDAPDDQGFDPAPSPPAAYLVSGDSLIPAEQGSYCWTPDDGSPGLCADMFWPTDLPPGATFEAGEALVLRFEDTPPDSLTMHIYDAATLADGPGTSAIDQGEVALTDGDAIWTPQVEPGSYLVTAFAQWPGTGDSSYFFGVEIIAAGSQGETNPLDGIDAADLAPPSIYLMVGDDLHKGSPGGYCWSPVKGEDGEAPPGICADVAVLDVDEFYALSEGENIHLVFDEPYPTTVTMDISPSLSDDPTESLTLEVMGDNLEWGPPLQAGDYIVTVRAVWEAQGDSLTLFGITWP